MRDLKVVLLVVICLQARIVYCVSSKSEFYDELSAKLAAIRYGLYARNRLNNLLHEVQLQAAERNYEEAELENFLENNIYGSSAELEYYNGLQEFELPYDLEDYLVGKTDYSLSEDSFGDNSGSNAHKEIFDAPFPTRRPQIPTVSTTRSFRISTPKPSTLAPRPRTLAPRPRTLAPRPRTLGPNPRTPTPRPRTVAPRPRTPAPKPRTPAPRPRTPAPRPRTPAPRPRTPAPRPRTLAPRPRTPAPRPRTVAPNPRTLRPILPTAPSTRIPFTRTLGPFPTFPTSTRLPPTSKPGIRRRKFCLKCLLCNRLIYKVQITISFLRKKKSVINRSFKFKLKKWLKKLMRLLRNCRKNSIKFKKRRNGMMKPYRIRMRKMRPYQLKKRRNKQKRRRGRKIRMRGRKIRMRGRKMRGRKMRGRKIRMRGRKIRKRGRKIRMRG